MNCLNCGKFVKGNQTFCDYCGKENIFCPKCGDVVSEDDLFCGRCGAELAHIIELAKKKKEEKEKSEKEQQEKELKEQKQKEIKREMEDYAYNLIIDSEGNKFSAIKKFKEKYNVHNDIAVEHINIAYNKISNEFEKNASIVNENVPPVIKQNEPSNQYIDPKGIKKTIIVSQSSRKKATSAISRGLIGGAILGPVGLLAGASAKSKETTTFQVIYNNGKQETIIVENGSRMFKEYCKYLDV